MRLRAEWEKIMVIESIKGAIFDVDGTLLDSMPVWESVSSDYLLSRGVHPRADLNDDLIELGGHEIPEYFQTKYGLRESAEDIQNGIYGLLEEFYLLKAMPKEGVFPVLNALCERGVKMCVATATDRWLIEPALKRCGLLKYFGRIFTCGEEKTSKSSPNIYIRAAAFLGTDINGTLVFEDALYAIKSAKRAGFPVVGVYDRSADRVQDEIKALCDYYYESLVDLTVVLP